MVPTNMSSRILSLQQNILGDLTVGIIGLGYVGLPTAIGFHDAGFTVWGVDVSQRTVDMVLQGKILPEILMLTILYPSQEQKDGISPLLQQRQCHIVTWYWLPYQHQSLMI